MWLPWQDGYEIAIALVVFVLVFRWTQRRWVVVAVATATEAAIVMTLYSTWQYIHDLTVTKTKGAISNAHRLWRFERWLHLPSEAWLEKVFINNRPIMDFVNVYYDTVHVPAAGALLIWMFVRHRDQYSKVRTVFALEIAGCLAIQATVPLAPPRFLPDLGFIDAAVKYGLSVYGTGGSGISNELAAMPSLHVGWALLVGYAVCTISTSKWRWLILLHPILTILAVTITANHWWLDGVVAGIILIVCYGIVHVAELVWQAAKHRYGFGAAATVDAEPDDDGPTAAERPLTNVT
jgi:hypothetical protein